MIIEIPRAPNSCSYIQEEFQSLRLVAAVCLRHRSIRAREGACADPTRWLEGLQEAHHQLDAIRVEHGRTEVGHLA